MSRSEKGGLAARNGSVRTFTPSASIAGDAPAGDPPTYAESIVSALPGSERSSVRPAYSDNKIQVDDELHGSSPSDSEESDDTLGDLANDDEAVWALDDAELPSYEDATNVPNEEELVAELISRQPPTRLPDNMPSLPCPIIVPQRNPRRGYQGFVRAYAPILQTVGIDEKTFMDFLTNLHRSTKINSWFTAIMVSSTTIDTAPSAVAMAVATAMQYEAHQGPVTEDKTNNFLDKMNEYMFKPCGCYAFITRYQEVDDASQESGFFGIAAANVDLRTNRIVPKFEGRDSAADLSNLTTRLKLFRLASNASPSAQQSSLASLTVPHVDHKTNGDSKEQHDTKAPVAEDNASREEAPAPAPSLLQSIVGGVTALHDSRSARRQARADRWAERHEKRKERRQERYDRHMRRVERRIDRDTERFQCRYGRPPNNRSAPSAEEVAASTPIGRTRIGQSSGILVDNQDTPRSEVGRSSRRRRHDRSSRHRTKGMSEGVLYLMIVALPTDQELADARAMLQGE